MSGGERRLFFGKDRKECGSREDHGPRHQGLSFVSPSHLALDAISRPHRGSSVTPLRPSLLAGAPDANEVLNERAVAVMKRMSDKLTGRDFSAVDSSSGSADPDSVQQQVSRLVKQATSAENLCQSYIGWCPFW